MPYDFTTVVDRRNAGSEKWNDMLEINPQVPAGIIPLSVADMELPNPPEIIHGLQDYLKDTVLGYSASTPAYREAVTSWMQRRHGWTIDADWIVETNGVVPALYASVQAYTQPGDGVLIMTPVYYPFFAAVERTGRTLHTSDLAINGDKYEMDFDDIARKAADPRTKLLIFCSPHNPVGRVWSREELARLGRICLENDVLIVSDEIHFDLIFPGRHHTVFSLVSDEIADRCIVCTAPSKTFNLAGMQTSNIIVKNEKLRAKLNRVLALMCVFSLNTLGYKACEIAYTQCDAWLDELLALMVKNRDFVADYLAKNIPAIKVFPLEGTYLQWWDCRELGMDYKELERFMTKDALLYLDEGHIFGKSGRGFERINLACPTVVLEQALDRLNNALKKK